MRVENNHRETGIDSSQVSLTVGTDEREVDVQYYTAGDGNRGTRPPLVLLHGIGLDAARVSFRHAIPALAQNRRVIDRKSVV